MSGIPSFSAFDVYGEDSSIWARCSKYVAKLENLLVAMNIDSRKRKKALMLHYAGDEIFEIYSTGGLSGDASNYDAGTSELK